jgi:CRP-like cAMP-binding protein
MRQVGTGAAVWRLLLVVVSAVVRAPVENRLLLALPRKEYQRILPTMEHVLLPIGAILYEPGDSIHQVHFPDSGIVSLLSLMQDRTTLEIGMVGSEGMVGLPVFFGSDTSSSRAIVRSAGTATRVRAKALRKELDQHGSLTRLLHQYSNALLTRLAQLAACNRFHTVEARIACWLLMTHDRTTSDELQITQEQIAQLLGVRRAGVTNGASSFQKRKLISYSRGNLRILNRVGLERASCECYRIIKAQSKGFLHEIAQA